MTIKLIAVRPLQGTWRAIVRDLAGHRPPRSRCAGCSCSVQQGIRWMRRSGGSARMTQWHGILPVSFEADYQTRKDARARKNEFVIEHSYMISCAADRRGGGGVIWGAGAPAENHPWPIGRRGRQRVIRFPCWGECSRNWREKATWRRRHSRRGESNVVTVEDSAHRGRDKSRGEEEQALYRSPRCFRKSSTPGSGRRAGARSGAAGGLKFAAARKDPPQARLRRRRAFFFDPLTAVMLADAARVPLTSSQGHMAGERGIIRSSRIGV